MRETIGIALTLGVIAMPSVAETTSERVSRYFQDWYSYCPKTKITIFATAEVRLPGYESYRVERSCDLKNHNEMAVTVVDSARDEVFVGELLHSDARVGQPFTPATDVPVLEAALRDSFGVPVSITVKPGSRGPLRPIQVSLMQARGAAATLPGFVSKDGATLMLGEFRSLAVAPATLRERLLAESPGVRPRRAASMSPPSSTSSARNAGCALRKSATSSRTTAAPWRSVSSRSSRSNDWAFAAAESAAALANVSPSLYFKYEEAIFPRAGDMTAASAQQLAADVAEAANVREAFSAELSSGRARARVLRDIDLALRLGLNGTPVFYYKGVCLRSEAGLAEGFIGNQLSEAASH